MKLFIFFILIAIGNICFAGLIENEGSIYFVNKNNKLKLFDSKGENASEVITYSISDMTPDENWAIIIASKTATGSRVAQHAFLYNIKHKKMIAPYSLISTTSKFELVNNQYFLKSLSSPLIDLKSIKVEFDNNIVKKCTLKIQTEISCHLSNNGDEYILSVDGKEMSIDYIPESILLYPHLVTFGFFEQASSIYTSIYWDYENDKTKKILKNKKTRKLSFDFVKENIDISSFGIIYRTIARNTARYKKENYDSIGIEILDFNNFRIYGINDPNGDSMVLLDKNNWTSIYLKKASTGTYTAKFNNMLFEVTYNDNIVESLRIDGIQKEFQALNPASTKF